MKIWFDTAPISRFAGANSSDDCSDCSDCDDCRSNSNELLFNGRVGQQTTKDIHKDMFQQVTQLYLYSCDDEHWLACQASGNGRVVVINNQALALLKQFHTPTSIYEVMQHATWSSRTVEEGVTLFSRLGLLQNIEQPIQATRESREETLSAWLHVTNACTLRCTYCYIGKSSDHMVDDTARRAVDAVFRSAVKHNFRRVQLKYAGGEASLRMANVLATHDYAAQLAEQHQMKLHAYMMSNGIILSQSSIEQLKMRHIGLMISLDGIGEIHDSQRPLISGKGSFKYVDRTISQLLASELIPHINVTISQRNLEGLPDLTRYILERNLSFTFSYYRDNECSSDIRDLQFADTQMIEGMHKAFDVIKQYMPRRRLIDSLIDKANMRSAHQHTCGVGRTYMVIDQRGKVAKCHANIKQTITTIDADDPLQMIRSEKSGVQAIAVEEKQGCRECEWRHWCTGGCPMLTYRVAGRNDVKSPNCNIYKALFPEALQLEALRLLKYETPLVW